MLHIIHVRSDPMIAQNEGLQRRVCNSAHNQACPQELMWEHLITRPVIYVSHVESDINNVPNV